jgi:hypothetical protein
MNEFFVGYKKSVFFADLFSTGFKINILSERSFQMSFDDFWVKFNDGT